MGEAANITFDLIRRDIAGRYRGSLLGVTWSLLTPLLILAVYTLMFSTIFEIKWGRADENESIAQFAVILFAGLIFFQLFSEVVTQAPGLIVSNRNFVKRIVFPLHVLPVVSVGVALFHALVSMLVLTLFSAFISGGVPATLFLMPLVVAPLAVMALGLAWLLSALGVYFRDIGQFIQPVVTALMFLSPIFVPRAAMPDWLQPWLLLNPLTVPVEAFREVMIFGTAPDWTALGLYSLAAIAVAFAGEAFFQATRRGFADVL